MTLTTCCLILLWCIGISSSGRSSRSNILGLMCNGEGLRPGSSWLALTPKWLSSLVFLTGPAWRRQYNINNAIYYIQKLTCSSSIKRTRFDPLDTLVPFAPLMADFSGVSDDGMFASLACKPICFSLSNRFSLCCSSKALRCSWMLLLPDCFNSSELLWPWVSWTDDASLSLLSSIFWVASSPSG